MRFEASWLEVKKVCFTKSTKCLKVLHLSDIHINRMKVPWEKVRAAIENQSPDFIIMTGDYIESPNHTEAFLDFLCNIKGIAPIYLCMGNHDHKSFNFDMNLVGDFIKKIEAIDSHSIHVVYNNSFTIKNNNKLYNLISFDDINAGQPNISKALSLTNPDSNITVAFSHNPDIILNIPRDSIDYLFCGHYHGGQIWMPFNLEFKIMRNDKLSKMGIRRGLHKVYGINLYINKGIGNVCFPLRFLSRPEITIYHIP